MHIYVYAPPITAVNTTQHMSGDIKCGAQLAKCKAGGRGHRLAGDKHCTCRIVNDLHAETHRKQQTNQNNEKQPPSESCKESHPTSSQTSLEKTSTERNDMKNKNKTEFPFLQFGVLK